MARGFRRQGEAVVADLDERERAFMLALLVQTGQLLRPGPAQPEPADSFEAMMQDAGIFADPAEAGGPTGGGPGQGESGPEDPALARLLPPGHRQDAELAAEFRRLTREGLRERKAARLAAAAESVREALGDRLRLTAEQAEAMVVALTDVRLVLGERLALTEDADAELLHARLAEMDADDPMLGLAVAYDFVTWLQETLVEALTS